MMQKQWLLFIVILAVMGIAPMATRTIVAQDCNGNGLPDSWDLGTNMDVSGSVASFGGCTSGNGCTARSGELPPSAGTVRIDFNATNTSIDGSVTYYVIVNGVTVASYTTSGSALLCYTVDFTANISAGTWNSAIAQNSSNTVISLRKTNEGHTFGCLVYTERASVRVRYTSLKTSNDCDGNGQPDECQPDCDGDKIPDACELDTDGDGTPDDCEEDCNNNGTPDFREEVFMRSNGQVLPSAISWGVALGDLDNDQDLDAFIANQNQNPNIVWINQGGIQSGTPAFFLDSGQILGASNSFRVALGDLDGDQDLDAFIANDGQPNEIWFNNGSGIFTNSGQQLSQNSSIDVVLADLDKDNDLDAFIVNHYGQPDEVWINQGGVQGGTKGVFADSGQQLGNSDGYAVALGDVDGDGDIDAFVANANNQPNTLWLNNGSASFTDSGRNLGTGNSTGVALGDLDGDSDLDAFITNRSGQPESVWINQGGIQTATPGYFISNGQSLSNQDSYAVALGDLDGDNDLDAFVGTNGQGCRVWVNDGRGFFGDSGLILDNYLNRDVALGDLDRDGDIDAFVANDGSAQERVYLTSLDCNKNQRADDCDFTGCRFPTDDLTGPTQLTIPWLVIGPPDDQYFGLGNGAITYQLSCGWIEDASGPDLNVYEVDSGVVEFNVMTVLVSEDGVTFTDIKASEGPVRRIPGDSVHGNDAFALSYDIASAGLSIARFVRIQGTAAGAPGGSNGFDMDAIGIIHPRGISSDCNNNNLPDECDTDCDADGIPDDCDTPIPPIAKMFVKSASEGTGDGSSWSNAIALQTALCVARENPGMVRELWVAEGVHTPRGGINDSFELVSGLAIYGGFGGTETALSQRNLANFHTLLSGDINNDDLFAFGNRSDNSDHVVKAKNVNATALLDGFTISGGNALGAITDLPDNTLLLHLDDPAGAPYYLDSSGLGNPARYLVNSRPDVAVESIRGGALSFDGSADYLEVTHRTSVDPKKTVTMAFWVKVDMLKNTWTPVLYKGAGNQVANRSYTLWLKDTGSILVTSGDGVTENTLQTADGLINTGVWYHIAGVIDRYNGFMRIYLNGVKVGEGPVLTTPTATNTLPLRIGWTHESNAAYIRLDGILDEIALYNRVLGDEEIQLLYQGGGGGVLLLDSRPTFRNCRVLDNKAGIGAGVWAYSFKGLPAPGPNFINTIFFNNYAQATGGAIQTSIPMTVLNSSFTGNLAGWNGGALMLEEPTPLNLKSGALAGPTVNLYNSILWSDIVMSPTGAQEINASRGTLNARYNCVQGGWPGTGNLNQDPLFMDAPNGVVRLAPESPCIDRANSNDVPANVTIDIDGLPRFFDYPLAANNGAGSQPWLDMGPYEFQLELATLAEAVVPPAGASGQPISINPSTAAFWHPGESRVYVKEANQLLTITWPGNISETYATIPKTPTVALYQALDKNNPLRVDLTPVVDGFPSAQAILHYNSAVKNASDANIISIGIMKNLLVGWNPGTIVLEYRNDEIGHPTNGRLMHFEIVDIRRNAPTTYTNFKVGDQLLAGQALDDTCNALIWRGDGIINPGPEYVYRQPFAGSTDMNIYGVRPTSQQNDIEIYWHRESYGGVCWPFEFSRYVLQWPGDPQIFVRRSGVNDPNKPEPLIDMTAHQSAQIKTAIPSGHLEFESDRKLRSTQPGMAAVMYIDRDTLGSGQHVSFDIIKTVNNNDAAYGFPIQQPVFIGDRIQDSGVRPDAVLWLPFEERQGATAYTDLSGNNNFGSCSGADCPIPGVSGRFGKALELDGNTDHVRVGVSPVLNVNQVTLSAWVKVVNLGSTQAVITKANNTGGLQYGLEILPNGNLLFGVTIGSVTRELRTSNFAVTPGQWTFLAAAYDGQRMRVFKNGVLYNTAPSYPGALGKFATTVLIGRWSNTHHLRGRIDEAVIYDRALQPAEIEALYEEGYASGFIFSGNPYDPSLYNRDIFYDANKRRDPSDIFIVNENILSQPLQIWHFTESVTRQGGRSKVYWPSKVVEYTGVWPNPPDHCITISNLKGAGPFIPASYGQKEIYDQPDSALPGFNPNEEHAQWDVSNGNQLYAARDDINSVSGYSKPYALVKYKNLNEPGSPWEMDIVGINRDGANGTIPGCPCIAQPCSFTYSATAGVPLEPIAPLRFAQPCGDENTVDEPQLFWKDGWPVPTLFVRKGDGTATARFYERWGGQCVPWLDDGTGTPHPVTYPASWPRYPSSLLPPGAVKTKNFYVDVGYNQTRNIPARRVEILYNETGASVIMPWKVSAVNLPLNFVPQNFEDLKDNLKPDTRARLRYDVVGQLLIFEGLRGLNLIGIMTAEEKAEIRAVYTAGISDPAMRTQFLAAVDNLFTETNNNPITQIGEILHPATSQWGLALSTGSASKTGWVVLGYNGNYPNPDGSYPPHLPQLTSPPSDVEVYKVDCDLDAGAITVIYPPCVFDEQVTLRWTGDCGGDCSRFEFKWEYAVGDNPDRYDDIVTDVTPTLVPNPAWTRYVDPDHPDTDGDGWVLGQNQITVRGSNLLTLTDNWFHVKVRIPPDAAPGEFACSPGTESPFTPAELKEGWLKRVKRGLNLFDQRIKDFHKSPIATYVSVMEQLGAPSPDQAILSCNPVIINSAGLIDLYNTVLSRARSFTIDSPGYASYQPANQALILIAGTLAEFYTLIANEAYADSTDPTVALRTDSSQGLIAPSLFAFQGQFPWSPNSLLLEELTLLRGRDNRDGTGIGTAPVYNRLPWNFITDTEAQVAYQQTYNIKDRYPYNAETGAHGDGKIDEKDAAYMYPMGHGDAWGHQLTAQQYYYNMLRHPRFDWPVSSEYVKVGPLSVEVNFAHERKFARFAASHAQTGREIVNSTYRLLYTEDPEEQWKGYPDPVSGRNWGVTDWGRRAFMGAYFDWATANAIVPANDNNPSHQGTVKQVDRTTINQLRDIAAQARQIQETLDHADGGLNPLGIAKNVVPFDLKPQPSDPGSPLQSHYEQIAERAQTVLLNTRKVWDHANTASQLLRTHEDTVQKFQNSIEDSESDFNNRLIEIFGYPYPEDINPLTGDIYGVGYVGPDLYHWMYVDGGDLLGLNQSFGDTISKGSGIPQGREIEVTLQTEEVDGEGVITKTPRKVKFNVVPGFGLMTPVNFKIARRSPGEIQLARSDLLQAWWRFKKSLTAYSNKLADIEGEAEDLEAQYNLRSSEINIQRGNLTAQTALSALVVASQFRKMIWKASSQTADDAGKDAAEALPRAVGMANDVTAPARGILRTIGSKIAAGLRAFAEAEDAMQLTFENAKSLADKGVDLRIKVLTRDYEQEVAVRKLEKSIRELAAMELDIYSMQEEIRQMSGRYLAAITKGERLLTDLQQFRQTSAEEITQYRYEDIAYRLFRNDALQKYRAQFDLGAQYVYLAAKAYGYETNLLDFDARSGERLLEQVVRERVLGRIEDDGTPQGNSGLAGVLRLLNQNFAALRPLLGFNNPVIAADKFSLRRQFFRISPDASGDATWRQALHNAYRADLRALPDFNQFFQHFRPADDPTPEPALVFDFSTRIDPDLNFFGWEGSTLGGDSFYLPTYYAIRIREAGVFFKSYDDSFGTGLAESPAAYLGPVGSDVMRVPNVGQNVSRTERTREWNLIDQILPIPNDLTLDDFDTRGDGWTPTHPTQLGGSVPLTPLTRKHSPFRASHDGPNAGGDQFIDNTFLIGRSVWNTRWLLIIPGRFLLQGDPNLGINRFIDGSSGNGMVSDILLSYKTYQYRSPLSSKPLDENSLAASEAPFDSGTERSPDLINMPIARPAPAPDSMDSEFHAAASAGSYSESGFQAFLRSAVAGNGILSEPPLVIYGRLQDSNGGKVTWGTMNFSFAPSGGGPSVQVSATIGDLSTDVSYFAIVPNETGVDTADADSLKLGGVTYVPGASYDGRIVQIQMENPLSPSRGRIIGPVNMTVLAGSSPTPTITPTLSPTETPLGPTPTPHPSSDLPKLALDVNQDQVIDELDLLILLDYERTGQLLVYQGNRYIVDDRLFMIFAHYWHDTAP